jgi:addiction module HigA family antidote
MIRSFKCPNTEALSIGIRIKRFANIATIARRKLRQLEIAGNLEDLRIPPGNRLKGLKGNRAGQYSIRINGQWRVCFRWTEAGAEVMRKLKPITPGEILLEEFLKPMGLSQYRLAKEIGVPAQRISEVVAGKRSITADTDLRLCKFFGLSNGYWLRAQAAHDTEVAERQMGPVLTKIRPWTAVVAQQDASADRDSRGS